MTTEFFDQLQTDAHSLFQEWRLENPDGFFLTPKGKANYLLHHVGCAHIGNPFWNREDAIQSRGSAHSLTASRKVCSSDPDELLLWLADEGFALGICRHCVDACDPNQ
jgi:hypothetical protein